MIKKQYRAEIDGLRAWAVLGVLFYHFDIPLFSGGFTGVDIFFVISGFLITQNILVDIGRGTFSFTRFYTRRIKRLFPALYATLFLTLLFGYLLFTPEHYLRLGKSLLYSVLSVSNVFFWQEAGYFDTTVDFKPLLHTWSLAVEEQFYLVWPAILFALSKLGRHVWILLFLFVSSAVSLYWTELWLSSDPSGAFFLTPFRIIEFAFGGVLVWLVPIQPKNKLLLEPLLFTALLLILYSFFALSNHTAFPGIYALIPCLGAALAIYSGQARFIGRLLRNPVSVGIGLISYSLYLIHWPLLIFYKYWHYSEVSRTDRLGLFLAVFVLAWLSWKFIEQPFRKRSISSQKLLTAFYVAFAALLLAAAAAVIQQAGFPERISSKFNKAKNTEEFHYDQYGGKGYPFVGLLGEKRADKKDYDVVLTGDSFILQYATGFDRLFQQENITAKTVTDYACIIGPGITSMFKGQVDTECIKRNNELFNLLKTHNKPLILSEAWAWYNIGICDHDGKLFKFKNEHQFHDFLIGNLQKIREKIGAERKLIIIGNPPGSGNRNGIISCLNRPVFLPNNCLESMSFPKKKGAGIKINKRLRSYAANEKNTWFLDPFEVFCDQDSCHALDYNNNKIWFSDGGHISIDGSIKAADYFGQELVRIIRSNSSQSSPTP